MPIRAGNKKIKARLATNGDNKEGLSLQGAVLHLKRSLYTPDLIAGLSELYTVIVSTVAELPTDEGAPLFCSR